MINATWHQINSGSQYWIAVPARSIKTHDCTLNDWPPTRREVIEQVIGAGLASRSDGERCAVWFGADGPRLRVHVYAARKVRLELVWERKTPSQPVAALVSA